MKHHSYIILITSLCSLILSCSTTATAPDGRKLTKQEQRQETARKVAEALDSRYYKIDVDMAHPLRMPAKVLSYGFSLEVHGDSLISYLPYFGRAYSIPYGGGKGLNFTSTISSYQMEYPKKDRARIYLITKNDEDVYSFLIEVFINGKATIDVQARERDMISFDGEIVTD